MPRDTRRRPLSLPELISPNTTSFRNPPTSLCEAEARKGALTAEVISIEAKLAEQKNSGGVINSGWRGRLVRILIQKQKLLRELKRWIKQTAEEPSGIKDQLITDAYYLLQRLAHDGVALTDADQGVLDAMRQHLAKKVGIDLGEGGVCSTCGAREAEPGRHRCGSCREALDDYVDDAANGNVSTSLEHGEGPGD